MIVAKHLWNFNFGVKLSSWVKMIGGVKYRLNDLQRKANACNVISVKFALFISFANIQNYSLLFLFKEYTSTLCNGDMMPSLKKK